MSYLVRWLGNWIKEMNMAMKLWLLTRGNTAMDEVVGFVVRATTNRHARKLAAEQHMDEGVDVWLDRTKSTCVQVEQEGAAGVVLKADGSGF